MDNENIVEENPFDADLEEMEMANEPNAAPINEPEAVAPVEVAEPSRIIEANPFDADLDEMEAFKQAKFNQDVMDTEETTSEQQSEVNALSKEFKVPREFVGQNVKSFRAESRKKEFDYTKLKKENPYLAEWLTTTGNVALAHKKLNELKALEVQARVIQDNPDTLGGSFWAGSASSFRSLDRGILHLRADKGDKSVFEEMARLNREERDIEPPPSYQAYLKRNEKESAEADVANANFYRAYKDFNSDQIIDSLANLADTGGASISETLDIVTAHDARSLMYTATQSMDSVVVPMAVGVGAGLYTGAMGTVGGGGILSPVTGPAGFAGGFVAGTSLTAGVIQYSKSMDGYLRKYNPDLDPYDAKSLERAYGNPGMMKQVRRDSTTKAVTVQIFEGVATMLGGKAIDIALSGTAKTIPGKIAKGATAFGAAQVVEGVSEGGGELTSEYIIEGEIGPGVYAGAINEGLAGLFMGGASSAAIYAGGKALDAGYVAKDTLVRTVKEAKTLHSEVILGGEFAQNLRDLADRATEVDLDNQDPAAVDALIDDASGSTQVYMQAEEFEDHFAELGDDPVAKADELLPGGRKALEKAKAEGSSLEIPVKDFIGKFREEPSFDALTDKVRRSSTVLNAVDGKNIGKELPNLMKHIAKEAKRIKKEQTTTQEFKTKVKKDIKQQLIAAGVANAEAEANADLYSSVSKVLGELQGLNPQEYAEQVGLVVGRFGNVPDGSLQQESEVAEGETLLGRGHHPELSTEASLTDKDIVSKAVATQGRAEIFEDQLLDMIVTTHATIKKQGGKMKADTYLILRLKDAETLIKTLRSIKDTLPTKPTNIYKQQDAEIENLKADVKQAKGALKAGPVDDVAYTYDEDIAEIEAETYFIDNEDSLVTWLGGSENTSGRFKLFNSEMGPDLKARALDNLAKTTEVYVDSQGRKYFKLYRVVSNDELATSSRGLTNPTSSWTANPDFVAHLLETDVFGGDVEYTNVVSSLIREDQIKVIPREVVQHAKGNSIGQGVANEYEVIATGDVAVNTHKLGLEQFKEVRKEGLENLDAAKKRESYLKNNKVLDLRSEEDLKEVLGSKGLEESDSIFLKEGNFTEFTPEAGEAIASEVQEGGYDSVIFADEDIDNILKDIKTKAQKSYTSEYKGILFQQDTSSPPRTKLDLLKESLEESLGKELNLDIYDGRYVRSDDYLTDQYDEDLFKHPDQFLEPQLKGARATRAKEQGFDLDHAWHHGSKADIEEFSSTTLGASTGAGSARLAHFFASSPSLASDYAEASDDTLSLRGAKTEGEAYADREKFVESMREKYGPKWVSKLSVDEKAQRASIAKKFKQAAEDFRKSQIPAYKVDHLKDDIKYQKVEIAFLEKAIKEKAWEAKKAKLTKTLEYYDALAKGTWVKPEGERHYNITGEDGKKIANTAFAHKTDGSQYRFYDTPENNETRISKINERIGTYTPAKYRRELKEKRTGLKEMETSLKDAQAGIEGQTVYTTVLKLQNPLMVDFKGAPYREITYREILEKAQEQGYDGVIFENTYDPAFVGSGSAEPELVDVAAVFDPTQIRSVHAQFKDPNSSKIVAQKDNKPRGFTDFSKEGEALLGLLRDANQSTILHEMGHVFLEGIKTTEDKLRSLETLDQGQQAFIDAVDGMLSHFKLDSTAQIEVKQHEEFARLFESYLMDGKAPTEEMRGIFKIFKTWLTSIYRDLKGLEKSAGTPLNLSPEMSEMFDRMLATDEELREARDTMQYAEPEDFLNQIGITDTISSEDLTKFRLAHTEAKDEATVNLYRKQVDQAKQKKGAAYKAEKKVLIAKYAEIAKDIPVFIARKFIKEGIEGFDTIKMKTSDVKALLTPEEFKSFPRSLYSSEGIDPDLTADVLGWDNGKELINEIANTPKEEEWVKFKAQEDLDAKYPNFNNPSQEEELKVAALDSVHNDKQADLLKIELELMLKNSPEQFMKLMSKLAKRLPSDKDMKRRAKTTIANSVIEDSRPVGYQRIETQSKNKAIAMLGKGDFEAAVHAKMLEIYNHELYKVASQSALDVEKAVKKAKKRFAIPDSKINKKKFNNDMFKVAQTILASYGVFTDIQVDNIHTYLKQLEKYDPAAYGKVSVLVDKLREQDPVPYKQLTHNQFNDVMDTVDTIYNLAEAENNIIVDGEAVSTFEVVEELKSTLDNQKKKKPQEDKTKWGKFKMAAASLDAVMSRVEHLTHYLDGAKALGAFTKYIWNLGNEAQMRYTEVYTQQMEKLVAILKGPLKGLTLDQTKIDLTGYFKGVDPETAVITKSELFMMLVHSGNNSNKRKLLVGRNLGTLDIDGELVSKEYDAFIEDMIARGIIDKNLMDGAQAIWDLFEDFKPEIQKTFLRTTGSFFNEVEANAISTPWGEYRGGYAPAITDPLLVEASAIHETKETTQQQADQFAYAQTPKGMTKDRVLAYNKALSLNFSLIKTHIEKSVRFATIEPALYDLNKIFNNTEFSELMFSKHSKWKIETFLPWMGRLQTQKTTIPATTAIGSYAAGVLNHLRNATTAGLMFFNVPNTIEQVVDFGPLLLEVDGKEMALNISKLTLDSEYRKAAMETIRENSKYMDQRLSGQMHVIADQYAEITQHKEGVAGKLQTVQDFAKAHTFILQSTMDNMMTVTAWTTAYNAALVEFGGDTKKAARKADSIIRRIMGSGRPTDVSNIESGPIYMKLVLTFYGYFNNKGNLVRYAQKGQKGKYYSLGMAIPAIGSALIMLALKGKYGEEDDEETFFEDAFDVVAMSQLRFGAATIPFAGTLARFAEGQFTEAPYDNRIGISPSVGGAESVGGLVKLLTKDEIKGRDVRDAITFLGIVSGLPLRPVGKSIGFMIDLDKGTQRADTPLDYARGLSLGRSGKK